MADPLDQFRRNATALDGSITALGTPGEVARRLLADGRRIDIEAIWGIEPCPRPGHQKGDRRR